MGQMTNSKEIKLTVSGSRVVIRELSVGEVRKWFVGLDDESKDLVDQGLFEEVAIPDLVRMTSLGASEIDELQPSDVHEIINACKDLNPDFFGFRARLLAASQAVRLPA